MEPNKWEKEFKEQLNSREIKPSEQSWAKLDAMLSATEKPKTKFPWMYIAASFVGILLIGTVYFSQKENTVVLEKNEVVIQNTIEAESNKKALKILNTNANKTENKVVEVPKQSRKPELKRQPVIVKDSFNQNQEVVSVNNQIKENDVVVNPSEKKNKYISAEKLLAEVSDAKFEPKATAEMNGKIRKHISVNPNRLLSDAEKELNQSYRESVLDLVNKNFKAIKTALVNRNYEE